MCGTYSIDPISHKFIDNLAPLTTPENIKKFLSDFEKKNTKFKGKRTINNVVKFIEANSASPMESRLFIKLCGSRNEGFYSCRELIMNKQIQLSKEARKIAGQNVVIPDIVCEKLKLAIEYNSAQFHESSEQGQKDCRRRDALVYDG